jgi:hypothetical protein
MPKMLSSILNLPQNHLGFFFLMPFPGPYPMPITLLSLRQDRIWISFPDIMYTDKLCCKDTCDNGERYKCTQDPYRL